MKFFLPPIISILLFIVKKHISEVPYPCESNILSLEHHAYYLIGQWHRLEWHSGYSDKILLELQMVKFELFRVKHPFIIYFCREFHLPFTVIQPVG